MAYIWYLVSHLCWFDVSVLHWTKAVGFCIIGMLLGNMGNEGHFQNYGVIMDSARFLSYRSEFVAIAIHDYQYMSNPRG
jgi:hypothetical protein